MTEKPTLIIEPIDVDQRLKEKGMSWDRYRCQNTECRHYDMSHSNPEVFGLDKCTVEGCKCEKFVYGPHYD